MEQTLITDILEFMTRQDALIKKHLYQEAATIIAEEAFGFFSYNRPRLYDSN